MQIICKWLVNSATNMITIVSVVREKLMLGYKMGIGVRSSSCRIVLLNKFIIINAFGNNYLVFDTGLFLLT